MTHFIKKEFTGVRGTALIWIKIYLSEKKMWNLGMLNLHCKTLFVVSHSDPY